MSKGMSYLFSGTNGSREVAINITASDQLISEIDEICSFANTSSAKRHPMVIKKIRIKLEYHAYCLWLYDKNDNFIDNNNPPEWADDSELTNAFIAVCDLYDTFFVDNENGISYTGCPNKEIANRLRQLFTKAVDILVKKNNGKYIIQNDVDLENI